MLVLLYTATCEGQVAVLIIDVPIVRLFCIVQGPISICIWLDRSSCIIRVLYSANMGRLRSQYKRCFLHHSMFSNQQSAPRNVNTARFIVYFILEMESHENHPNIHFCANRSQKFKKLFSASSVVIPSPNQLYILGRE